MSVHDLDRHRALVRASREIPAGLGREIPAEPFDWDQPRPADWLTPAAHPEQPGPLIPRSDRAQSRARPSRDALAIPRLALALLMLAAVSILALALIGAATAWRWAAALFGTAL